MRASNLHDLWASPDNTRLTSKQYSFRLPTHVAAKIEALCEMFPNKNRTQLVADLLTSALDELEENLPQRLGEKVDPPVQRDLEDFCQEELEQHYDLGGLRGQFRNLCNQHFAAIERELGNDSPAQLFADMYVTESDLQKGKP
jgi:hypothetical protein